MRLTSQVQTPFWTVQETLQSNENDNNKNRRYETIDTRIKETYGKASKATLHTKLYDAYVRFFRWATDRLGDRDGIVCFVTNNGFLRGTAFDGFRQQLLQDFTHIYHFDCKGNARMNGEQRRAEGGNVFYDQIRTGVGITVLVRRRKETRGQAKVQYFTLADYMRAGDKLASIIKSNGITGVKWETLHPDSKQNWLTEGIQADFEGFLPIASKEAKASKSREVQAIFKDYSLGISTNRDGIVYDFNKHKTARRVEKFIADYNEEVSRWISAGRPKAIDEFVTYSAIKWSRNLKNELKRERKIDFDASSIRYAIYRPYTTMWLYSGHGLIDEHGTTGSFFPLKIASQDNVAVVIGGYGRKDFSALATNLIPNLNFYADPAQCFPLYTYALDGKLRRDNVTDWALAQFQAQYGPDVTKRDIFHYVYGLLHSPEYRARYKENLKRELPRVPLVEDGTALGTGTGSAGLLLNESRGDLMPGDAGLSSVSETLSLNSRPALPVPVPSAAPVPSVLVNMSPFRRFADAGEALAALHVGYEDAAEYPLEPKTNPDVPFSWRVTKMRLSKDKTAVVVNEALTLAGIPPEAFEYKLGNRSALEWVLDQYQVSTDKRSGIETDPNRDDDPEYIVRLVRRVVTVSVETVRIVQSLPPLTTAPATLP